MEYLIVRFPEVRDVLVDGVAQGKTNLVLELESGIHDVSLVSPRNFSPLEQKVLLQSTSPMDPARVDFHRLPPSAIPISPGSQS